MSVLTDLVTAISSGAVEVIDLTAPLSAQTPILKLPEPLGQTWRFGLQEISRYNEAGPAWYWNNITTGEHTGTHLDAPIHWVTGKDGADVSQLPARRLIAPAAVLDFSAEAAKDPNFVLEIQHVEAWQKQHGPLPKGGCRRQARWCSSGRCRSCGAPAARAAHWRSSSGRHEGRRGRRPRPGRARRRSRVRRGRQRQLPCHQRRDRGRRAVLRRRARGR